MAQQKQAAGTSTRVPSTPPTPKRAGNNGAKKGGTSTPIRSTDASQLDLAALNLNTPREPQTPPDEPPPKITMAREKVLEEAKKALEDKGERKGVSMVVVGKPCFLPVLFVS